MKKINYLLIFALLVVFVGSTREIVAFPMERKSEEKKISSLDSITATERNRRESEVSKLGDENVGDLKRGDFIHLGEEHSEINQEIQERVSQLL